MKLLRIDMTKKHFKPKAKPGKGISKDILRQLKGLEKHLPPIAVEAYSGDTAPDSMYGVRGEQLLEANPNAVDKDGRAISKDAMYELPLKHKHSANHLRRLKEAYTQGGWEAVDKYVRSVKKLVIDESTKTPTQDGPTEEK